MQSQSDFPCGHTRNLENVNLVKRLGRRDVQVCKTCANERRSRNHAKRDKELHRQQTARRRQEKRKEAGTVRTWTFPGEWALQGICRKSAEPDAWFGTDIGKAISEAGLQAKEACGFCPVRVECLKFALDTNERHGIWGGTTPAERTRMRSKGNGLAC